MKSVSALLRAVLDPAQQVVVGVMVLVDHRRAVIGLPRRQHIDPVTVGPGHFLRFLGHPGAEQLRLVLLLRQKMLKMGNDILLDPRQVRLDVLHVCVLPAQRLEGLRDDARYHFAIKLVELLAALLLPGRRLAKRPAHLFLQLFDVFLDLLLVVLGQLLEFFGPQGLAVLHGRQGEAGRRANEHDVPGLGFLRSSRMACCCCSLRPSSIDSLRVRYSSLSNTAGIARPSSAMSWLMSDASSDPLPAGSFRTWGLR